MNQITPDNLPYSYFRSFIREHVLCGLPYHFSKIYAFRVPRSKQLADMDIFLKNPNNSIVMNPVNPILR